MKSEILLFFKNLLYLPLFFFGLPIKGIFILSILIFIDIFTGLAKSVRVQGWHSITSKQFAFGIIFKACIMLIPIVLAIAGEGVGIDLIFFAKGALSMLVLSETYSILGNIYSFRTGKAQKEFDAVNYSISKIRDGLITLLKK